MSVAHPPEAVPAPQALPQAAPTQGRPPGRPKGGFFRWIRTALPTLVVIGVLIGLASWGHATDWTLPKFSEVMTGKRAKSAALCATGEGWCPDHNVAEADCIECNKTLVPALKDYGWCKEHGIAQCPLDHPEVAQLKTVPTIAPEDLQRASRALALLPRVESNQTCKVYQKRIQFASQESIDKAGVDIAVVDQRPVIETIPANGEVIYDQTRSAHLASRVAGTVWRVEKRVGDQVRQGDILALIDSAEVGRAKSELLQALAEVRLKQTNVQRLQPLAGGSIPGKQLREAEAGYQEAQIKLVGAQQALVNLGLPVKKESLLQLATDDVVKKIQFLGLPESLTAKFDEESTTSNLFPLRSPLDGVVAECKVVPGEVVETTAMLFGVADMKKMWLILDVRQEDVARLSTDLPVLFKPVDDKAAPEIKGRIGWISTEADDKTRTVKVRVDLPNADGRLRANTFGMGRIVLREEPRAVVIPTEAIHSDGDCNIVFVRDKNFLGAGTPKFFYVREVRLGVQDANTTEVIAGLLPGEVIASKNSMVLEAQLLKSNLGAGCACCAPAKKKAD